jgi:hypothetical protein
MAKTNNFRWVNDLGNHLIKSATFSFTPMVWYCQSCNNSLGSSELPKPEICNSILEKKLNFTKLAILTNGDAKQLQEKYETDLRNLETAAGYLERSDLESLSEADECVEAWDITRCTSKKIIKKELNNPIDSRFSEWDTKYKEISQKYEELCR